MRITAQELGERISKSEFYVFLDKSGCVVGCVFINRHEKSALLWTFGTYRSPSWQRIGGKNYECH